jgi:hypothetical protein
MDSGAQQDISDSGAPASAAGTAEDAGAGDTSAGIDKGKRPAVPEVWTNPAPASAGQTTPAAPVKGICPRGNNKVVIILFRVHNTCLFLMLELY